MTEVPSEPQAAPEQALDADRELVELPAPRRPWRRATLLSLTLGALGSLALAAAVFPDVRYCLRGGVPRELGDLARAELSAELGDSWVHGAGQLSAKNAIRFRRPLESDSYRLASIDGNPKVWVQIRVPAGAEDSRFVPPDSFVGRLMPVSELGLRQRALPEAVGAVGLPVPPSDAWVLLDGESPSALSWVAGLFALLLAFAAFNLVGLFRLTRPIPRVSGQPT